MNGAKGTKEDSEKERKHRMKESTTDGNTEKRI